MPELYPEANEPDLDPTDSNASKNYSASGDARKGKKSKEPSPKQIKSKIKKGGKETASESSFPVDFNELKQKAIEFVNKGSDELSQRYAMAFGDALDVSQKVRERMKGKPQRIAMGAAGVLGLGVVLAKRYHQRHDKAGSSAKA